MTQCISLRRMTVDSRDRQQSAVGSSRSAGRSQRPEYRRSCSRRRPMCRRPPGTSGPRNPRPPFHRRGLDQRTTPASAAEPPHAARCRIVGRTARSPELCPRTAPLPPPHTARRPAGPDPRQRRGRLPAARRAPRGRLRCRTCPSTRAAARRPVGLSLRRAALPHSRGRHSPLHARLRRRNPSSLEQRWLATGRRRSGLRLGSLHPGRTGSEPHVGVRALQPGGTDR